ncbi:unnamed protein product [Calypogeia fissa]
MRKLFFHFYLVCLGSHSADVSLALTHIDLVGGLGCFRFVDMDTPTMLAEDPVHGGYKVNGAVYTFLKTIYGHWGRLH